MTFALTSTKWTLDLITRLVKADVRVHNAGAIEEDMAVVYVVNHFTRMETMLLPYVLHKHTGQIIWSLGADELFRGRIGSYLRQTGTISTKDPDRDKVIINTLLTGAHPWIIFPEGGMVKDKKVVNPDGMFEVYSQGGRRPPHTGAAVLALRTEFYRFKLECIFNNPKLEGERAAILERFGLESIEPVLGKRTMIVPVNVTYYPIRSTDNILLRLARTMLKDLSPRALEELSVEGTVLSEDTDVDITLGEPIRVRDYLESPEFAGLMQCGDDDLQALEEQPESAFVNAARALMIRYMADIYRLTRINFDHLFATLVRHQPNPRFTDREYRNRVFLCAHNLLRMEEGYQVHTLLTQRYRELLFEEPSPKFANFLALCIEEGLLEQHGNVYTKNFALRQGRQDFHTVRRHELTYVIANEIEPLANLTRMVREIAELPRESLSIRIRELFLAEDKRLFEEDYARHYQSGLSRERDLVSPFLLEPPRILGGVVLVHGYLSAPAEVRPLADYLVRKGFAVYGVRLHGHGTAPEDLADTNWEDWYESLNRGYAIIKSLTDYIILGGFSAGGTLALYAAGQKGARIQGVFAINAPLHLRSYMARLASSDSVSMHALLRRWKGPYVDHTSENPHLNYARNPLHGVRELGKAMRAMQASLPSIAAPALIIQGAHDPVVDPASGLEIFQRTGAAEKELTLFERDRHGIVNGEGVEQVFDRVERFIHFTRKLPQPQPSAGQTTTAAAAPREDTGSG